MFDAALQRPSEQRDSFVRDECDGEPDIEREVLSLLASLDGSEALERSPVAAGSDETDVDESESPKDLIPGYRILRELHRGGQGVVYQALQLSTKQKVAVKVMLDGPFASASSKRRFEREAELIGRLRHPGIVPVFDSGVSHGKHYFVMEYVRGQRLNEHVRDRDLSPRDILRLFVKICHAVDHAHQRGVIHRDLKPSNILVDDRGEPKVVDFGLAKHGGSSPGTGTTVNMSATGQIMGTPDYMSPEQAAGTIEQIDLRSDVYSLGVVLYELLTNTLPFELASTVPEDFPSGRSATPRHPRKLNRSISSEVETILLKAISIDKSRRYGTAGALAADLERYLTGQAIEARRDSILYLLRKAMRRHLLTAVLVAAGLLALVVVCVLGWSLYLSADEAKRAANLASMQFRSERDESERLRERARRQLYYAKMNLAGQVTAESFGTDTIRAALEGWIPKADEPDLRGWEWYYLYAHSHREAFASRLQEGWIWEADYNPYGTQYALAVNGAEFQVREAATGKILRRRRTGSMRCLDWSPDGELIATGTMRGETEVRNAETLESVWKDISEAGRVVYRVRFSPDSQSIAIAYNSEPTGRAIHIRNAADGTLVRKLTGHKHIVTDFRWSPDGSRLASTARDATLRIWDMSTGRETNSIRLETPFNAVAWSADGKRLATGGKLSIWHAETGKLVDSIPTIDAQSLDWHPRTHTIACGGGNGRIVIYSPDTHSFRTLHGHTHGVSSVSWSPDARQILSSGTKDRTVRVWDVHCEDRSQTFMQPSGSSGAGSVEWSPDGKMVASVNRFGRRLYIWDVRTQREVFKDSNSRDEMDRVAWGPQSSQVAFTCKDGVFITQLRNGTIRHLDTLPRRSAPSITWHRNGRLAAGFRQPINQLVVFTSDGRVLKVIERPHELVTRTVAWNNEGTRLATTGATDGMIRVWDAESGTVVWEVKQDPVRAAAWTADDRTLTTSHDGFLILRDASTGRELRRLDSVRESFGSIDSNPIANRIVAGSAASVSIWDPVAGTVTMKFNSPAHGDVRWSPDGTCIAAGCDSGVRIWDARRGFELLGSKTINAHRER